MKFLGIEAKSASKLVKLRGHIDEFKERSWLK